MRKGQRVYVRWRDIQALNHSDEPLPTAKAELVGWVISAKGKDVQFETCRYVDGTPLKDRITIPKGCIDHCEVI
jgi:hypothetical protein